MSKKTSSTTPQSEGLGEDGMTGTCAQDGVEPMDTRTSDVISSDPPTASSNSPASGDLYRHFSVEVDGEDTSSKLEAFEDKLEAFKHNCELTVKKKVPYFSGCHDLDCFLHAVASGVVVASIDKLPGDGLPNGVYQFQMSCRKDLPTPNQNYDSPQKCPRHDMASINCKTFREHDLKMKDKACAGTRDFRYSPYTKGNERELTYVECPIPMKHQRGDKTQLGEIKFKLKPQVKTVYNPAIWTKEKLATKCNEAFENAVGDINGGTVNKVMKRWSGPFTGDDGKTYWMEGFYKTIENRNQIYRFNFVHPDILKKAMEHHTKTPSSPPETN